MVARGWDPLGKRSVLGHAREGDQGTDAPAAAQLAQAARTAFGTVQRYADQFPVTDQAEADALARSLMLRASGDEVFVRGEAQGNPLIGAGVEVAIERVGSRLAGKYRVTWVDHLYGSNRPVRDPVRLRRQGVALVHRPGPARVRRRREARPA